MAEKLTRTYNYDDETLYTKAKAELERKLNEKLGQFNPEFDWSEGDKTGKFKVMGVKGDVKIKNSVLTIEMKIPLTLAMMKGKIISSIERSLDKI
jgi:hypothetical protein